MSQRGDRGEGHARRPGRSSSFGGHRGGGVGGAGKGGGPPSGGQPPLSSNRSFRKPTNGHGGHQRVVSQPDTTGFQPASAPGPLQTPPRPPAPQNAPAHVPVPAPRPQHHEGLKVAFSVPVQPALKQQLPQPPPPQQQQPQPQQQQQTRKDAVGSSQPNSVNPHVPSQVKRDVHVSPSIPNMAGMADEANWDFLAHGVYEGEFASILRKLLHYLGYKEQPIYRGVKTTEGGEESWMMEIFIYAKSEQDPPHVFTTEHQRSTLSAAIQDAARLAAARLCDDYKNTLRRTPYCYYPSRRDGARYNETFMPTNEDDPMLTHQVNLTRAMGAAHTAALEEITTLRQHLVARHTAMVTLQEQLAQCKQALAEAKMCRYSA